MQICISQMELALTAIHVHFQILPFMRPTNLAGIIGEGKILTFCYLSIFFFFLFQHVML